MSIRLILFSGLEIFNYAKFNSFMIKMFSIGEKIDALREKEKRLSHVGGQWVHFSHIALPVQNNVFLSVFYLVFFSFFPPQIQVPNFFTRYMNGKFN